MSGVQIKEDKPPTRAVERVREIIVGRQLERLEQRLYQWEADRKGGGIEEKHLSVVEARMEAMEHVIQRMGEQIRMEELRRAEMQEEMQRMAMRIQQLGDGQNAPSSGLYDGQLEEKVAAWLGQWQASLQAHLATRDEWLTGQFRSELSRLWEYLQYQMAEVGPSHNTLDHSEAVEERFRRIAEAAYALAECAAGQRITGAPTLY